MRSLCLTILLAGCASQQPTVGEPRDRFVGEWMIDQPFHALYEASWYVFHDGGALEHVRDCSFGGPIPTGFVTDAGEAVHCEFGAAWSARAIDSLVIDGACSDGRARPIVLGFPEDASGNVAGQAAIEVVSVGGEPGWGHFTWDWSWHACRDTGCTPQLSCP